MNTITEGKAVFVAVEEKVVSKDMETFYNPVMKRNRDLSLVLLQALGRTGLKLADPLAGSGVRTLRMLTELDGDIIDSLMVNDMKKEYGKEFMQNAKLTGLDEETLKKITVLNTEGSYALLQSRRFDYIDIDPFGTPNPFLDAAVKRIRNKGILAVTATDTAALCGTYPKACRRKYDAIPRRDEQMHEAGLRILIRKVQVVGAQYAMSLRPVLSLSTDHYFRIYFEAQEGKKLVDEEMKLHGMWDLAGPLWRGALHDAQLVKKMLLIAENEYPKQVKLLSLVAEEAELAETIGFYDTHVLSAELKLGAPPRSEKIIEELISRGYDACKTHISGTGIRSTASKEIVEKTMKKLSGENK